MEVEESVNVVFSILEQVAKNPTKTALEFIDTPENPVQLTYADLWLRLNQGGDYLIKKGAQKGDRVLIAVNQGIDYLTSFYGCVSRGLVAVPVCAVTRENQWNRTLHVINDCGAKFILTDNRTTPLMQSCLEKSVLFSKVVLINVEEISSAEIQSVQFLSHHIQTYPIAFLQYTSGSTGAPKGVMVSHKNLLANFLMMQAGTAVDEFSKVVSWLPLFHDMGLIGSGLLTLYSRATLYFMSPLRFLRNPFLWLEAISKYRGTHAYAPNFAYDALVSHSQDYKGILDLSSWLVALSGAEPIRFSTAQRFIATFGKHGFNAESFYPAYGMAESTLYVTGSDVRAPLSYDSLDALALQNGEVRANSAESTSKKQRVVSCGKARGKSDVFIVNPDTLKLCDLRTIGEIWVKGDHVCEGYFGKKALTEEVFRVYTQDKKIGPCLRTGDLGYMNEKGEVFVTGRLKDLIIINGKNFYPHDIEETVLNTNNVIRANSVVAFSIDNGEKEELVIVVELRVNLSKLEADKLASEIKKIVLKEHAVLVADIVFGRRGSILRTTSGKLQRQLCKKNFLENTLERIEFLEKERTV